jgi:hypothetical protein
MTTQWITKRTVDVLRANGSEFTVWDGAVTGFGVRVRQSGAKSYVVIYRAVVGHGAHLPPPRIAPFRDIDTVSCSS